MPTAASILVTGASSGIGATCALRLDRLGYQVFAGVRKPEDGQSLATQASSRLVPLILDVTKPAEIEAATARVRELVGASGLAGLVNNAGVGVGGPIEFVPVDQFRMVFEVNVFGLLAVTQAMLPLLRATKGRIVNIGSIAGLTVSPFATPYCMSKYAVEALTDGLRLELADAGIAVAVIEPGPVKTRIWEKGIASLGNAERTLPAEALRRYGPKLAFFGKLLAASDARGVSPDLVVDAVIHALVAPRPRTRYLVGRDARIRASIARLLPDRLGDAILRRVLARLEKQLG
jgi:NAD(P)-dependent dehydrogenase (short-subunit alcohol dehydrogenase family)